jgi:glutaredoxin 3
MSEAAKNFVNEQLNSHKVVVFSGSYCPYCVKAKKALANYKINDIKIIELDQEYPNEFNSIMGYLGKLTGEDTVSS